jgi:hypothetical protein
MQVSSGTALYSAQALLQAAQLSDLSPSLFGTLSTQPAATQPPAATTAPTPIANLLSPSLTQALINSTQLDANPSEASSSATTTPSSQAAPSAWNPLNVFMPLDAIATARDSDGQILTPQDPWANITQSDVTTLDAKFGIKQVQEQGITESLQTNGQPIEDQTWIAFEQTAQTISEDRANGSLSGNLTETVLNNFISSLKT